MESRCGFVLGPLVADECREMELVACMMIDLLMRREIKSKKTAK
jgi:hypothetical protein